MIGGTGSGSEKPITVTKIIDINLQQKRNKKIPSPDEVEAMDSIDITKQVLDHPEMAAAFFKRGLFGTYKGVIPANKIIKKTLNKYIDSKKEYEKILKIFKVGKLWTFNLSRNSVNFNNLELDMNKSYSVKVDKQPSKYGVEAILLNGVEPTLINGKRTDIKYSIEIKGYDESTKEYITTIWVNGKSQDDIRMTLDKNF
jgi:hypothetical protein